MKRHKVDIGNLPREEVVAINRENNVMVGYLFHAYSSLGVKFIRCSNHISIQSLNYVTHYITKEDLLNSPEESETMESEEMLWGEAARAIVAHYENGDMDENDTTLSELKQHFIIQRR